MFQAKLYRLHALILIGLQLVNRNDFLWQKILLPEKYGVEMPAMLG
jgi:hypothetical protein